MNKAFEFTRDFWVTAQVKAPPCVQRVVIPRLHEAKEIVRLLARPHLPVYEIQGQGQGGPLTVTHIGLEYAKPALKGILFAGNPVEQKVGQIPFWHCEEIANGSSSDIVIVEAAKHLIRRLPSQSAIVVPEYVHSILDVRGDWQDIKSRFHKSARRELRSIQKYGYEYEVSHDDQDFEMFYHNMYLPTMEARHGALSSPASIKEAYQYFRRGLLFFVKRDGQRVCGSLFYVEQGIVYFKIVGVINGDEQYMKDGVTGPLNYLRIQWANQQGYKAVNFLGADPHLRGGLFQFKRKWGTTVSVPQNLHRQIWIKVQRITPAVSRFLKENPFIVVDKNGKLHGLIAVDDPRDVSAQTAEDWRKRYVTPGLSSLIIRSVSDFAEDQASVNDSDLVILIPPSSGF